MREILILDTETSGLDPAKDHLIEVGLVRWSVQHRTTLEATSCIVRAPENPAEPINGIPAAILGSGRELGMVHAMVASWASPCEAIAAHNGEFDQQWFPPLERPWIDTAWDVEWPRAGNAESRKVHALCLAHGLAVFDAHRALPDCQLLARLLERVAELGHDVTKLLERAMRPKVKVLSLAPFEQKDVVKQHGFRWNPEQKIWWRMMPAEDVEALPFRTNLSAPRAKRQADTKRTAAGPPPADAATHPPAGEPGPAAAAPSPEVGLEGKIALEILACSTHAEVKEVVDRARALKAAGKLSPENVENLRKVIAQHTADIRDGKLEPRTMPKEGN